MTCWYTDHKVVKGDMVTIIRIHDMDRASSMAPLQGYFEQYTLDDRVYRCGSLTFHADAWSADRGMIEAGQLSDFDGVGDLPLTVKMFLYGRGMGGTYIDNDPIVLREIAKREVV